MYEATQLNTDDYATLVRSLGCRGGLLDLPSLNERMVIAFLPVEGLVFLRRPPNESSRPLLRFNIELWTEYGGFVGWNYQGLIDALSNLQEVPDALGYTHLTEQEAASIRSCGFWAEPGLWEVPALPYELVMGNGLLECFSDWWLEANPRVPLAGLPSRTGFARFIAVDLQSRITAATAVDPTSEHSPDEKRILSLLPKSGGVMLKRRLQQGLWRMGSRRFGSALRNLERRGEVKVEGKWVKRSPITCGDFSRLPVALPV